MRFIKGMTFYPFAPQGAFSDLRTIESLKEMKLRTKADTVILVPAGWQQTSHSESIDYKSERTVSDQELITLIKTAQDLNLKVILKPTVNCLNGEWRAFINFFDEDVPCEPKWSNWFRSYTEFQIHYAKIAQDTGCEMFIAGCEMVMAERREEEWRELFIAIRKVYQGLVSYNTDKYQEHRVKWWDCVDVISSSGYYPINEWETQLDRIEQVVKKYQKPFFFAEFGCMSTKGSELIPNNWELQGETCSESQREWYQKAIEAICKRKWMEGIGVWSWDGELYSDGEALKHRFYEIYKKPAEDVVRCYFEN